MLKEIIAMLIGLIKSKSDRVNEATIGYFIEKKTEEE